MKTLVGFGCAVLMGLSMQGGFCCIVAVMGVVFSMVWRQHGIVFCQNLNSRCAKKTFAMTKHDIHSSYTTNTIYKFLNVSWNTYHCQFAYTT